jgi:nucleoside-diphosphate-sugar epimerase
MPGGDVVDRMDVLIIGGTGLISSEIVRLLVDRGHDLTLYNRGETDADIPDVTTIHGDRTDHSQFEDQLSAIDVDCVIDMYCMTPADAESAVDTFGGRIDQYVFCSTVDVYRSPPETYPITEDHPRMHPEGTRGYAPDKAVCERVFERAHDQGAFDLTTIRPGYTYGEGRGLLTTLGFGLAIVARLRRGDPVVVHGDGTALWGACHRDDVARAFANIVGNEDARGEDYHLTSEEWMPWNQYVRCIADAAGAPDPDLVHVPTDLLCSLVPGDRTAPLERVTQYSFYYDNSKAARDLDFEYTVDWTRGAERVIDHVDWGRGAEQVVEDYDEYAESGIDPDALESRLVEAWNEAREEAVRSMRS